MVYDNIMDELLSEADHFWSALEELAGPISAERRDALSRLRLLRDVQSAHLGGDERAKEKALTLAQQLLQAFEAGAQTNFEERLAHSHPLEPPKWWRDHYRAFFARFRPLQEEALKQFGVAEPIPPELVPLHVERLSRTMVKAGTSTTLVYPAGLPMWVDHFTNENARSITVYTGISAADRALLQTTASAGEDPREAAADLDELDLDYRAGSPLYRVTRLEELMCERLHDTAFGIEGWEAVLYLLCDILPEVPWIEIGDVLADFGPRTYIEVPSLEISAREVASAYAEYVREMVPGALPRTSPKSAWPSQLVAFVLEYRHTHGARPTWAEIHEAWLAVHPGVYGSLQSFRNTFNRVVKRYPDPGELPGDRDRSAQTRSPRRQT